MIKSKAFSGKLLVGLLALLLIGGFTQWLYAQELPRLAGQKPKAPEVQAIGQGLERHGAVDVVYASAFSSNGDLIKRLYWLREKDRWALWIFDGLDLRNVKSDTVWVLFKIQVADTVNGGPGWDANAPVSVYAIPTRYAPAVKANPRPEAILKLGIGPIWQGKVLLVNPYRPRLPGPGCHTFGWGTDAYGHLPLPVERIRDTGLLVVVMTWPGVPGPGSTPTHKNWQHLGTSKERCYLAYQNKPCPLIAPTKTP